MTALIQPIMPTASSMPSTMVNAVVPHSFIHSFIQAYPSKYRPIPAGNKNSYGSSLRKHLTFLRNERGFQTWLVLFKRHILISD